MSDPVLKKVPIASQDYDAEYYDKACDGYLEFNETHGRSIPFRLKLPLTLAELRTGMHVVDIGCGRGEIVLHAVQSGAIVWGLDFSRAAVNIAMATLKENLNANIITYCAIQQCDATKMPFLDNVIDRIFMLDIVEHLTPEELSQTLQEANRILNYEGFLVIHTMPSLWYYRYGYRIFRLIQRIRRVELPNDPRERCDYSHFHVNEQSPTSLRKVLSKTGFKARVWLQTTQDYSYEKNRLIRVLMKFLVSIYPFRLIFCNDIFAIGKKSDD